MEHRAIYTVGYGGRSIESLLRALRLHSISYVIDVRSRPYSKFQPDFNRETLDASVRTEGLRYVFMGDLLGGRPDDPGCYDAEGHVLYRVCREKDFFRRGIQRLTTAREKGLAVCIMCSEAKPHECHRSKLIGEALKDATIPVLHILPSDDLEPQDSVMALLSRGQGDLFGASLHSRKKYRASG